MLFAFWVILSKILLAVATVSGPDAPYRVVTETVSPGTDSLFLQARAAVIPDSKRAEQVITLSYYGFGTHAYGDMYQISRSSPHSPWSAPTPIAGLKKELIEDTLFRVIGDVTPAWHQKTRTLLATGKSFFSLANVRTDMPNQKRIDLEHLQEVAYATMNPKTGHWSSIKVVKLPERLSNGDRFYCTNAGCTQRFDLDNGNVLLPVRYLKGKHYVTTVLLCRFDGDQLSYVRHGTSLSVPSGRGLYEPSLTRHKGWYYLTMRADDGAWVAKSRDGLTFEPAVEWKFDDDQLLGSYNTQQHWITHKSGLYLVYTRKAGYNDAVFRHRAPLFMAKVNTGNLRIVRASEQEIIPIPKNNGDLGNFGVTDVSPNETWITASVSPKDLNARQRETAVIVSRILWNR